MVYLDTKATNQTGIPMINVATLMTILFAGSMATVAFEMFGNSLSPMFGYSKLAPVPLANGVIKTVFGAGYRPGAELLHYTAGMLAYPIGWMFIARPIYKKIMPALPEFIAATAYGIALWVFALYFMAHLIAGNAAFLGFTGITWVALAGHIVYAWVAAWVVAWREKTVH
jgi:hypothetical protein